MTRTTAERRSPLAGLALVAVAWLARGSDGRAGPPGKSGGTAGLVLRLAVLEYPGKPAAQIAERYAQRVEDLSNGSIRVTIVYWPTRFERTTPSSRVEASAIRAVRAGEPQLGLIPSHAFEAQGVTTFRALQAPLLITSAAQAARVTTGALADRLQAGLTGLGLTGLGLVPEGLQRPFGFLKPLVSPADFAAVTIRADSSRATRDVLRSARRPPGRPRRRRQRHLGLQRLRQRRRVASQRRRRLPAGRLHRRQHRALSEGRCARRLDRRLRPPQAGAAGRPPACGRRSACRFDRGGGRARRGGRVLSGRRNDRGRHSGRGACTPDEGRTAARCDAA